MDLINVNVGGTTFSTRFSTLRQFPNTRLGRLTTSSEEYIKEKDYFFFDRNPEVFQSILDFYRHGNLHVPSNICGATLKRELDYWQIPLQKISSCCLAVICRHEDTMCSMELLTTSFSNERDKPSEDSGSCRNKVQVVRRMVWMFLTERDSSTLAKVFNIFCYLMAALSVLIFVLSTHPSFRDSRWGNTNFINTTMMAKQAAAYSDTALKFLKHNNPKYQMLMRTVIKRPLKIMDQICLFFFTIELFLKMITCPSIFRFFRSILIVLDAVIVVGLLIAFSLEQHELIIISSSEIFWLYAICKLIVILRVIRLFRLTRDIGGLRVLGLAIKSSLKQLLSLGISVLIMIVFFAVLIYYVEIYNGSAAFENIPVTIWWSIITVTTVGYGDVTPSTAPGYVIASFCAVFGILLVAMPIAIVASTFGELSFLNRVREREVELGRSMHASRTTQSPQLAVNKIHVKS